jgi:hypothetical protein
MCVRNAYECPESLRGLLWVASQKPEVGFRYWTVVLDGLRCSGLSHEGCQRLCLLFWKTAWLRSVVGDHTAEASGGGIGSDDPFPENERVAGRVFLSSHAAVSNRLRPEAGRYLSNLSRQRSRRYGPI